MLRSDVNQALLDLFPDPNYLEIGVSQAETFHAVRAARKVAVDPAFAFDVAVAKADPANVACEYHAVTSDVYFSNVKTTNQVFDVVFIDGLHTFNQTLKDLMNAIMSLQPKGMIVIDDIIPTGYAASISDLGLFLQFKAMTGLQDASWMGDVFRLVAFVDQYLPLFSYATVMENHGQMVLWRDSRPPADQPLMPISAIANQDYFDFVLKSARLNLKPFTEIKAAIQAAI